MGTSSSNPGQKPSTPLLPNWSDSAPPVDPQIPIQPGGNDKNGKDKQPPEVTPKGFDNRFRQPRSDFTRYLSSGGRSKSSLGSAISRCIASGYGGAGTAARRMTASRYAASNLMTYLSDIKREGLDATLKKISKENLIGKPPKEIFASLVDVICPSDGSIDVGIARDAFIETIIIQSDEIENELNFTDQQINTIVIQFISKTISLRLINDIGTKYDFTELDATSAIQIQAAVDGFIFDSVRNQLHARLDEVDNGISRNDLEPLMNKIYENAFEILRIEAEGIK
ncbi:MAG: hypothetical protein A2Y03_00560 [Omnitrophica WOR_2 bacterium GWF2_38_59]|nr:MAG: hypothetical protein A2Y03_00560 [Omnitrophica WOR_2 bacterium GWF2_38_59]OGX49531.1 MAG: hypothetical protein A2243_10645 [Omnitrophica WOR_2 bacterium RIFOXYA2_FULL_38_17]OGX58727.1 MAG: hypothetical protein A2306_12270 [Omnitrophica WOR_2 bacterium RIFOXYB2_FULL_38_16]HBG62164.1 hypothetical protein [Candidatus Omnitrophota bacterium]